MPKYPNTKIYYITSDKVPLSKRKYYIGHTVCLLCKRFNDHKSKYRTQEGDTSVKEIFDLYGMENCYIVLIKAFPCTTVEEALAEEQKTVINTNGLNINFK